MELRALRFDSFVRRLRMFLVLVRFEHTIFTLPFAYMGMLLAADGLPTLWQFTWVSVAMASARSTAFAVNRLVDRDYDARNPRAMNRPSVTGAISPRAVTMFATASLLIFLVSAALLNSLALELSPIAVICLIGYSYTKRFTPLSHWALGFTDALSVGGGWIAVRGSFFTPDDLPVWLLSVAAMFWMSGFDVIYGCEDYDVDVAEGLYSWAARYGIASALRVSSLCHVAFVVFAVLAGLAALLGWPYYIALLAAIVMLIYEHRLISPDDLSRLNTAFFTMNAYISVTLLAGTFLAVML
jgi:4-hydroxybenzoate polyprenyltransferase